MTKLLQILITIIMMSSTIGAQDEEEFVPTKRDSLRGIRLFKTSEKIIENNLNSYNGIHKKDYKTLAKDLTKNLSTDYTQICFHNEYLDYLKSIIDLIKSGNPDLENIDIRPFFLHDHVPNAYNSGEGTIMVNIGLLSILENEAQLAFILGHEIAHQSMNHQLKSFEEFHDFMYSEDFQNLIKNANKSGIERYTKLKGLIKTFSIDHSRHSRGNETESDSMGFVYLSNTSYDLSKGIIAIERLKLADTELFDMNTILATNFNFETAPFKNEWIARKQSMSDKMKYDLSKETKDSLSTHPDTEMRYTKLKEQLSSSSINPSERSEAAVSKEQFSKMKQAFQYQTIHYLIEINEISKAMYYILKFQDEGDRSRYLTKKMYECLQIIQKKLHDHNLGRYVEARNPFFLAEYNKLLIFIDNLNSKDIESIITNYKLKHNL